MFAVVLPKEAFLPKSTVPDFVQSFTTTILPDDPNLPELFFVSITRDLTRQIALIDELELADPSNAQFLIRDLTTAYSVNIISAIAAHLRAGTTGALTVSTIPQYDKLAEAIYDSGF